VRAGSDFKDWGIVDHAAGCCRTCASHNAHCVHVAALTGDGVELPTAKPDSEAQWQRWNADFAKASLAASGG